MENVISENKKTRKSLRKADIMVPSRPNMTLEEILEICPFTRKKHEEAKSTLEKCPIPDWIFRAKEIQTYQIKQR
jgi:hypothetical protein